MSHLQQLLLLVSNMFGSFKANTMSDRVNYIAAQIDRINYIALGGGYRIVLVVDDSSITVTAVPVEPLYCSPESLAARIQYEITNSNDEILTSVRLRGSPNDTVTIAMVIRSDVTLTLHIYVPTSSNE